jgi:alpha-mannosidase
VDALPIRLIEHGPVKSVIRVESAYGASHLIQDFTLYRDLERIDVHVAVDWHERFKALKLSFPLNLLFTSPTYEIPYGFIQRPANGEEEPGQSWIDLAGVGRTNGTLLGMSVLNDGKYSFDVKDYEINLTVLRSPIYAHHAPYEPQPGRHYTFQDQGLQRFTYSLLPHAGGWEDAGTVKRALELNQPLVVLPESFHPGPLPSRASHLTVDRENVVVAAMKCAEDGDDLILRCFETAGRATRATIHLPCWNRVIEADFRPSEIKTFRIPADGREPVRETNLLEL